MYKLSFEPLLIGLLYLEIIFKLISNIAITFDSCFLILINSLFIATLFSFLGSFLPKKVRKILFYIILFIFTIYFCSQFLVNTMFGFYYDFGILDQAKQITAFLYDTFILIKNNILYLLILLVPFIISLIFIKKLEFEDFKLKTKILIIIVSILSFSFQYAYMYLKADEINSSYYLAFETRNTNLAINKLGVLNTLESDAYKTITGFKEEIIVEEEEVVEEVKEFEYHQLDFDFDYLNAIESDQDIIDINTYVQSSNGTLENEYTGYFEDKNVIVVIAESFSKLAVSEDLTPTLYKMINNGFVFNNYYTTSMYSTVGGEFQFNTGLYPLSGCTDIWKAGTNYYPQGIGYMFKNNGYSTYAYHDNTYNYLDRDKYIASVGFDNYIGCYNGMECKIDCSTWTESDLEMIDATVDDYINDDKFMVYYTTVSGHGLYTYDQSENIMGSKYKEFIESKGYNYSEAVMAYLSGQIELDRAMESLINHLDESGKLDDTVIVICADHYPYYLKENEINELAGKTVEQYIDVNENNLIIYNSAMSAVQVDKVGSTIDVLPTIYNLMGFDYDSRLFVGNDILSSAKGLAMFGNNSWVSDDGKYYTSTGEFVAFKDDVDEETINNTCKIVNNRINLSYEIISNDYYRKLFEN